MMSPGPFFSSFRDKKPLHHLETDRLLQFMLARNHSIWQSLRLRLAIRREAAGSNGDGRSQGLQDLVCAQISRDDLSN